MDKQMTFDEWHQNTDSLCPRRAFEAGWQLKQAELEERDKRLNAAIDLFDRYWNGGVADEDFLELVEKALRGDDA